MLTAAIIDMNIADERRLNPLPLQAFADDIALLAYKLRTINVMIRSCEPS